MMEFAPSMFIFFFLALFPMLNLLGLGIAAATISMIASQTVQAAANSSAASQALTSMQSAADKIRNSAFGKFAKLAPIGGFNGCGAELYVVRTDFKTNANTTYGPLTASSLVPAPIDSNQFVYEYQVRVSYSVTPFINMSGIPFVSSVPGVGAPSNIQWAAHSQVEYPDGLTQ